jgi:hypothetical protein
MALILDGTVGATFPAGGVGNTAGAGVGTTDTQALSNKTLSLAAGTTSVPPLALNASSSAILTTQTAGTIEYDGKTMYAIPSTTGRGVIPSMSVFCLTGGSAGLNSTSAQNVFGQTSNTSWNPSATGISYMFEINIGMTKTAGATSHTVAFGFGGTATFSSVWYRGTSLGFPTSSTITGFTTTGFGQFAANTATSTVCSSAINNAAAHFSMTIRGTFSFSGTGSVIPQYTLSAAPGGSYTTLAGSYMWVFPIGNQAGPGGGGASAIRVGNWA